MWLKVFEILVKVVVEKNIFYVLSIVLLFSFECIVEVFEGYVWF